jgi:hypothetical protein
MKTRHKIVVSLALIGLSASLNATEITNTQITSTGVKIIVNLDSNLKAGEKVQIDYGKGLKNMTCKNQSCSTTLLATAFPKDTTKFDYTIGIYKNDTLLDGTSKTGMVDFVIPKPSPIIKTTGYTKIANDGSELLDDAVLGTNPKDWACTKDNKTGLIWEVKTDDGGLRDKDNTYTNYDAIYPKCDWTDCEKDYPGKLGDSTNTDGFVKAVNAQGLCGSSNWRLPTKSELVSLVYCSNDKYKTSGADAYDYICEDGATYPFINTTYFPNNSYTFWSSSPHASNSNYAWFVSFDNGTSNSFYKDVMSYVRLVQGTAICLN